jgi:hypothetical protein
VAPRKAAARSRSVEARQRLFDEATSRQKKRNKNVKAATGDRGWTRENLYDRGRAR